jgi:hypothetical protein
MRFGEVPGAVLVFLVAAVLIVVGVIGAVPLLRKPPAETEEADDGPRELNVYKQTACPITRGLIDRFGQMESGLAEMMKGQNMPADWAAHHKLLAAAEGEAKKGDSPAALQARCRSLLFLAETYHRARAKDESFKPNWRTGSDD